MKLSPARTLAIALSIPLLVFGAYALWSWQAETQARAAITQLQNDVLAEVQAARVEMDADTFQMYDRFSFLDCEAELPTEGQPEIVTGLHRMLAGYPPASGIEHVYCPPEELARIRSLACPTGAAPEDIDTAGMRVIRSQPVFFAARVATLKAALALHEGDLPAAAAWTAAAQRDGGVLLRGDTPWETLQGARVHLANELIRSLLSTAGDQPPSCVPESLTDAVAVSIAAALAGEIRSVLPLIIDEHWRAEDRPARDRLARAIVANKALLAAADAIMEASSAGASPADIMKRLNARTLHSDNPDVARYFSTRYSELDLFEIALRCAELADQLATLPRTGQPFTLRYELVTDEGTGQPESVEATLTSDDLAAAFATAGAFQSDGVLGTSRVTPAALDANELE